MKKIFIVFCLMFVLIGTATAGGFEKDLSLSGGVILTDAYHRIVAFNINLVDKIIRVEMVPYKDSIVEGADSKNYITGHSKIIFIRNDEITATTDYDDFLVEMNSGAVVPALEIWIKANDPYFKTATSVGIP